MISDINNNQPGGIMLRHFLIIALAAGLPLVTAAKAAEVPTSSSPLTFGNVQMHLQKGVTTQNDVLMTFGPPNIMTTDGDGNEVWTYQKQAVSSSGFSSHVYGTVILFGGSSSTSGFEQSSKTFTLIIKFNKNKKVIDYKSMATSF